MGLEDDRGCCWLLNRRPAVCCDICGYGRHVALSVLRSQKYPRRRSLSTACCPADEAADLTAQLGISSGASSQSSCTSIVVASWYSLSPRLGAAGSLCRLMGGALGVADQRRSARVEEANDGEGNELRICTVVVLLKTGKRVFRRLDQVRGDKKTRRCTPRARKKSATLSHKTLSLVTACVR